MSPLPSKIEKMPNNQNMSISWLIIFKTFKKTESGLYIYLLINQKTNQVIREEHYFHVFEETTFNDLSKRYKANIGENKTIEC